MGAKSDGANGTPRTASETRPLNVTGCWIIKIFGSVTNPGSADAAQLASDYASLVGRVAALELPRQWADMTANRAGATTYTNTSGREITVNVLTYHVNAGNSYLYVNDLLVAQEGASIGGGSNVNLRVALTAEIPPGATYRWSGGVTLEKWMELR